MGISVHTEEGILWGFWAWTLVFGFVGLDLGIWFCGLWTLVFGWFCGLCLRGFWAKGDFETKIQQANSKLIQRIKSNDMSILDFFPFRRPFFATSMT